MLSVPLLARNVNFFQLLAGDIERFARQTHSDEPGWLRLRRVGPPMHGASLNDMVLSNRKGFDLA